MFRSCRLAATAAFIAIGIHSSAQTRILVDSSATGARDGTSWEDAYVSLSEALFQASEGDTLWVAEGTYKPERDRDGGYDPVYYLTTFPMPNHIVLLGGFSGTETADTQRDWRAHPVILSGDIGVKDQRGDNCSHVVFNTDTALVDGFIIQDGNGTVHNTDLDFGAGVYNDGKLVIRNCIIRNNRCRYGGGLYSNNDSHLEMYRCLVYGNEAFYDGWGGSGEWGGIFMQWISYGLIEHCTVWGNNIGGPVGIGTYGDTMGIVNSCLVWENSIDNCTATYTLAPGITGATNIDADPLLSLPDSGDFSLGRGSPCINAADPSHPADPDGTRADIGYEIFEHDTIDLGILSFDFWKDGFVTGPQDVTITLESFGTETITDAEIHWEVDGSEQDPFDWTGSLSLYQSEDSIVIGSYDFSHDYHTLMAWITGPNGKTDEYPVNDTIEGRKFACDSVLHGTYAIGPSGNYSGFNKAREALCNCGISDSTTFLVEDGTYTEQIRLPEIPGASSDNRVIFRSQSGDSSKVVLSWTPGDQEAPYTLKLDSADHITIQGITVESRDSAWGRTIEIAHGAMDNEFLDNLITGDSLTDCLFCLEPADSTAYGLLIEGNRFSRGLWSIHLKGKAGGSRMQNVVIRDNIMENFDNGGLYIEWAIAPQITGNTIRSTNGSSAIGALAHLYYCYDHMLVTANRIYDTQTNGTVTGLRFNNCTGGGTGQEILVANNFISVHRANSCLTSYGSSGILFYNNSLFTFGITPEPVLEVGESGDRVFNNNIVNLGGGPAAGYYGGVPETDYNNYFSSGSNLIAASGIQYASLQQWVDSSEVDSNSLNAPSGFLGLTDLHTFSADLDSAGLPVSVITTDIDGQPRNPTHPDIGADEFDYPGPLRGDLLVGPSGEADFSTVAEALNALYMLHIDSTTNVILEPGDHEGQLVMLAIPGATSEHPLTFTAQSGDSSDTRITCNAQSYYYNYAYCLKGVRHVRFTKLGFATDKTSNYNGLVQMTDSCADVVFSNVSFDSPNDAYYLENTQLSSQDHRNDHLEVNGCNFSGGARAIDITGESLEALHRQVLIHNNRFTNQNDAAVYMELAAEPIILNNKMYSFYDFNVGGGNHRGLELHQVFMGDSIRPLIANNIAYFSSPSSGYTFRLENCDSLLVLHNSVYSAGTAFYAFECNGTIADNIWHAFKERHSVTVFDTAGLGLMHNDYFVDGLYDWETSFSMMDSTSVEADPLYTDTLTLTPTSPFLKNTGKYFAEVPEDFFGNARYPDPDIGAVEFGNPVYKVPSDTVVVCYGDEAILDAGPGFDSYLWSNDSTGQTFMLSSVLYGAVEEDFQLVADFRGNQYLGTVHVTIPYPEVDLGPDITNCEYDTVILDAGSGFDGYDWPGSLFDGQQYFTTSIDIYNSREYTVVATDDYACTAGDTVIISYKPQPGYVGIVFENDTAPTLVAQSTDDVLQYQWYLDGTPIDQATGDVYLPRENGAYTLEGISQEGCSRFSDEVLVTVIGITDRFSEDENLPFRIYPNPAGEKIHIRILKDMRDAEISLIDMQGRILKILNYEDLKRGSKLELEQKGFPGGVYTVRITFTGGINYTRYLKK